MDEAFQIWDNLVK